MKDYSVCNVFLWGQKMGAAAWDDSRKTVFFEYDPQFKKSGLEAAPLMMPLQGRQIYSFPTLSEETFQGLPGMLADSLPDYFGNQIINSYLRAHGRAENSFNAVEKLCYVGKRGIGALEYRPAWSKNAKSRKIEVNELAALAAEVLHDREKFHTSFGRKGQAFHDILQVGSSAGGARAKAVIAWNRKTNEVFSGQVEAPKGFEYWLLKFDTVKDNKSFGRIEYAYYLMAKAAGIEMSESRLLEEGEYAHFMTRRFDRVDGKKLHVQTLCAMAHLDYNDPISNSYEQAFEVMEKLHLLPGEKEQLFRKMVFNAVVRNHDDHTKNISFIMTPDGAWHLAPAYDMTWAYRPGSKWTGQHQMSINGKRDHFTHDDFIAVARHFDIGNAARIIRETCSAARAFGDFAQTAGVDPATINRMLREFRLDLAGK